MVTQEIDLNKLAEALGKSLTNNIGFLTEELADVIIVKAPVETDLVGGKITRSLIYSENLDDGDNPSSTPFQPPEVFYINNSL
ncbi:hypothetical protein, partial [Vibrio sp.]|uniref:hypothetical protein n=1 Tax=Vibrio sp. TaxID=678 RepID=UPI00379862D4